MSHRRAPAAQATRSAAREASARPSPVHARSRAQAQLGKRRRAPHNAWPLAAASRAAARGLTLLELAIAMAVLAILSALAAPSMASRMRSERLLGAAEMLAADIADARHEAARRRRDLHVQAAVGAAGGTWCWSVATSAACPCAQPGTGSANADVASSLGTPAANESPAANCRLKTVPAREHPGVQLLQAEPVQLGPDGQANPALAAAFSVGERQLHVQVSRFGRTRLCDPQGHSTRVPRC